MDRHVIPCLDKTSMSAVSLPMVANTTKPNTDMAAIPVYWLVLAESRQVEVMSAAQAGRYCHIRVFTSGERLPMG